jgi:Nucleotide modification associated domain 3
MKIILSRKGFDSSSGGVPNPILPDGTLLPLPIPDSRSSILYHDLHSEPLVSYDSSYSSLIEDLTKMRITRQQGAHLDPDLCRSHYARTHQWKPVFGQRGSALGHLKKQDVGIGDLFLFFGLFREVEFVDRQWCFVKTSRPRHIFWGWMQVEEVLLATQASDHYPWIIYHPHCQPEACDTDLLYLSSLAKTSGVHDSLGAGVFPSLKDNQVLSDPDRQQPSAWRLPCWFYPNQRMPLSFHAKPDRWSDDKDYCRLQSVARGQEFVLDTDQYPQALPWAQQLINDTD